MTLKKIIFVFIAALIIRANYVWFFVETTNLIYEDQALYIDLGENMAETGKFLNTIGNGFTADSLTSRVPGYPKLLAIIYTLFGKNNMTVVWIQVFIDSLTCVIIGLIAELFIARGFIIAGIISALNLNMIILSGMILADTLFLFLFSLFILFALYYFRFLTKTYLFLTIFFLSIATLVRPVSYFLIVLLLPLVIVALVWSGMKLKQILYRIFIYLSTVAIILGPIHYRNYDQYNSFLLVSQGGSHALKWIVPAVYQYSGQGSYQEGQLLAENHFKDAIHRNNFKISSNNPFENSSYQMQVANELIVELGLLNVLHAWSTGIVMNLLAPSVAYAPIIRAIEHPSFYKTNGNGLVEKLINYSMNISNLLYLLIIITGTMVSLIFLIISMFSFYKMIKSKRFEGKNRGILLFLLFIILYFMIITGPIIGVKYRLPIEPIMAVFFAYALIGFRKEKEKEKEKEKYNK